MAMDGVLKQLESKIEELAKAYRTARKNEIELAKKVEELEKKASADAESSDRVAALESQRDELAKRLEKVLSLVDSTLAQTD